MSEPNSRNRTDTPPLVFDPISMVKKHRFLSVIYTTIVFFVATMAFLTSVREASGNVKWSWDLIVGTTVFCKDSLVWLNERVDWLDNGEVVVSVDRQTNGPYFSPKYCPDRSEARPGERVTLDLTILSTGDAPLKNMWLTTYWQPDVIVPPQYVEYIPGDAQLFIDGQPQTLTEEWEKRGHQISELKPGQILSLKFTVVVSRSAPIGSTVTFPIRFYAEGFEWWDCQATARVV